MSNLIEMSGISKAFGGSVALRDVSLALEPGTVHALMGENGAGKSTLMKILAGVHQPDSGEIRRAGRTVGFANPRAALEAGISTVFQELSLLPNMTIAENMFLGREPAGRLGGIDRRRMRQETRGALARLGLPLNPDMLVSELSIAERQFVEIAHGIDADADVFILDEPTAALNAADVEILTMPSCWMTRNRRTARRTASRPASVLKSSGSREGTSGGSPLRLGAPEATCDIPALLATDDLLTTY